MQRENLGLQDAAARFDQLGGFERPVQPVERIDEEDDLEPQSPQKVREALRLGHHFFDRRPGEQAGPRDGLLDDAEIRHLGHGHGRRDDALLGRLGRREPPTHRVRARLRRGWWQRAGRWDRGRVAATPDQDRQQRADHMMSSHHDLSVLQRVGRQMTRAPPERGSRSAGHRARTASNVGPRPSGLQRRTTVVRSLRLGDPDLPDVVGVRVADLTERVQGQRRLLEQILEDRRPRGDQRAHVGRVDHRYSTILAADVVL